MKIFSKLIIAFYLIFVFNHHSLADVPYYIDFKFILNSSTAGKNAQDELKKKLENGISSLEKKEKSIQEEEKKLIQQKKIISAEEYKKKITDLRKKVSSLQKERNQLLNPIIHDYMKEKKIRMVINKKDLISADENLDITKDVMQILNKKLKSIKLN